MLAIKKILFPTDFFPCSEQAMDHALYLALKYEAQLHMLHAVVLFEHDPHNPAAHFKDLDEIDARLRRLASEKMTSAFRSHGASGVDVRMEQVRGVSAADVILDYARANDADLIVMGTHGRRGLGHLFLGSVAEEVVRLSKCPVLTIRERREPQAVGDVNRVLVPVDFSDHSTTALLHAKEIAATYDAAVDLLHVVEAPVQPDFYLMGGAGVVDLGAELDERAKTELTRLRRETLGTGVRGENHAIRGLAARDIVDFAERHATDLIVIATHGLTGVAHLVMGSVAEKVVRTARCPVCSIKAFGKSLLATS